MTLFNQNFMLSKKKRLFMTNSRIGKFSRDRKSTRLNSSHGYISYAVFCLKKKKEEVLFVRIAADGRNDPRAHVRYRLHKAGLRVVLPAPHLPARSLFSERLDLVSLDQARR